MKRILHTLKKWFFKTAPPPASEETQALRNTFRERYHSFKLLLGANTRALEIMAEIERALEGVRPFGMPLVRANCTGAAVNVLRMIKYFESLAPDKYPDLRTRFFDIRRHIDAILAEKQSTQIKDPVILLENIDSSMSEMVGAKMANIGEVKNRIGLNTPSGFVITNHAYDRFIRESGLQTEINRLLQIADPDDVESLYSLSAAIRRRIIRADVPQNISRAVLSAWKSIEKEMGRRITMALRSSAFGEDSPDKSFAGQYVSELNVAFENVLAAYKTVIAGKYTVQAITYRLNRGFRDEDIPMSVGCMVMVNAVSGGVAYSRNPVDIDDDAIVINSAWGLPKSVVDGSVPCDHFVVSRTDFENIILESIPEKSVRFVCSPDEGVCRMETSGTMAREPSVDRNQLKRIAEIALVLEKYYGPPQDIEWAVDRKDGIYVLQCRSFQPVFSAAKREVADPSDKSILLRGGVNASSGSACGPVFRVAKSADVLHFPKGSVLVARQALPEWASLLSRAVAVVTEQGGVAGHLANVAREFGVPALLGIEGALAVLNNGELITVNADGLTVYAGCKESLAKKKPAKNLMQGSPVFNILAEASRHITPLNLLNPDGPEFKPENCRTLHDITRFIHEKSVHEMFDFGKSNNFPERSSKQLHYNVPMQWWVLNLDDGFKTEVTGKYVKLEDIASIPMLAFWEGFVAVPWAGPPIDRKGLMSVMFQSTLNPALTPGLRSKYAQRNYFMISANYCSLNSRMGYHFSTLEAMVGERVSENYAVMRFKGGAADMARQIKRIHFLREILESYEFRVDVKEDLLTARIEGLDEITMKNSLRIIGYLTLHTRQLDMIMLNAAQVRYYDEKIRKDIDMMVSCPQSDNCGTKRSANSVLLRCTAKNRNRL